MIISEKQSQVHICLNKPCEYKLAVHQIKVKRRATWMWWQSWIQVQSLRIDLILPHCCQGEAEWHFILDESKEKEKREKRLWDTSSPPPSPANRFSASAKKPCLTGFSCLVPQRHNAKGLQAMGEGSVYWSIRGNMLKSGNMWVFEGGYKSW